MLKINIAINATGTTKYKPSVISKKLKNNYLIFICLFIPFIVQNYK